MSNRFVQTARGAAAQFARIVLVLLVIVTALFVVVSIRAVPQLVTNTQQASRNADLGNCRALAHLPLEKAQQDANAESTAGDQTQSAIVVALFQKDQAHADQLAIVLDGQRSAAARLSVVASDAAATYNERVRLSVDDPDQFLTECHAQAGGG